MADLYGLRAVPVGGGEIRGAGNLWICPEVYLPEASHCICLWHVEEWLFYCLPPFSVFLFMGGDAELCFRFSRGR